MKQNRFATFTWVVLAYTVAVILWGAYVRATGSGAGCGSHWPLCDGQVIPRTEQIETAIEFTHRLMSGLLGLLVLGMFVWSFRAHPKGHVVRRGAALSLVFVITEGLIGAGLVLFELVAYNDSVARTISIAAHLINTFLLLAFLTLTAWWANNGRPIRLKGQESAGWLLGIGFLGMLVLGASGAVTALGDTLFPAGSLAEGIRQDFSPTAHFLIRLRLWHPLLGIVLGLYLIWASTLVSAMRPSPHTIGFSRALKVLFIIQLAVGALNVYLLAPVWIQLVHLLLADAVWIALILLSATALAEEVPEAERTRLATQATD
ncbi:MAG TPA: COX15/CtaA family protein [Anaerolineae bacterium]